MIAWKYIDKPSAAIAALRDYTTMRDVINITPQEIKDLYNKITVPRCVQINGLPRAQASQGQESIMASSLDKLDVLQERYRQAVEYMVWFEPAWSTLMDDEQRILKEFYMVGSRRSGATKRLQVELDYSLRQIDRLREKAVSRMTLMLFGR